jgi:hypothetical protein
VNPSPTYDRRGRRADTVRNGITTSFSHNDADQPLTESYAGGTLNGLSVNRSYDQYLRVQTVQAKNGALLLQAATYGYDTARRFDRKGVKL